MPVPTYNPPAVLIVDTCPEMSGAEVTLVAMLKKWDQSRFHPIVAIPAIGTLPQQLAGIGVETHIVPMDPLVKTRNLLKASGYPWAVFSTVRRLARLAEERHVSLMHTNSLRAHLYGLLAAKLVGVPAVPYLHDLYPDGWVRRGLISLFEFGAVRIIVNSRAVQATFDDAPRCRDKVALIYPPLDEGFGPANSPEKVQAEFGLEGCYPVVGLVAHLHPMKRPEDLIQAAPLVLAEYPLARFLIVGGTHAAPPGYFEDLVQLVADLGLREQVTFVGFRHDVAEFYTAFDMLVLTSLGEPFGKVLIEAMASETPVIGTALAGPLEIIQHGVTGFLIPPCDPAAVADAILDLARHPEQAKAMGRAGRQWVKDRFSIERYTASMESLFGELLYSSDLQYQDQVDRLPGQ
ncbi:MAG: glycosyltransferase family 4 protein [Chloroflexi bacterium]|nr:glycosyltransferase family 4 protein [Chloroflexota bacterium]